MAKDDLVERLKDLFFNAGRDDLSELISACDEAAARIETILAATAQAGEVERECQAVWRCAIGDATTVIDMLKNLWLNSRRKHEREAGAVLSAIGDLIWAARGPAAKNYEEAFKLGKALTERARTALASGDVAKGEG